eukprot:CAMPEP_0185253366 /NCGR_PEP_ID=MMETSP1359-20130426/2148_1 /TAXON_ID=552665 /ORGANISM="Bigelowiella longifila, Strain CCMP242" /LENGTH=50 /DNA_ID=CAMNT_0027835735 /DNA_START=504 /DNA_END=656 /DNA_ORIENTATION=+
MKIDAGANYSSLSNSSVAESEPPFRHEMPLYDRVLGHNRTSLDRNEIVIE